MEKRIYEAPEVTVTKWAAEDIITTSGVKSVATPLNITVDNTDIAKVSYTDLAE